MELIGKILANRYEIIEKIGEGGMAYVFKARDNLLNRYVAVKVLKEEYSKDEVFVKRFRTEAQSAASLIHPNIVSVFDVGEDKGISFIVMELLDSNTLKDYIQQKGALPSDITLKIAAQIASALEAAHKAHIIHRDIKPQNILLNKNLVAKVTDFGIAKVSNATSATITSFGNTMGSVHYFSPEHAKGGYTDAKSDLYSLGVVMYEMATGKLPFDAVSVALKHIQEIPEEPRSVNPNVSPALNQIIMKAMEKSTANRYQTASELLTDISIALSKPTTSLVARPQSSIEAGDTQVIPILNDVDDENVVPNVRTRQSSVRSAYIPTAREIKDEEREEKKAEPKKKKITTNTKVLIAVFTVLILVVGSFSAYFIAKMVNNNKEEEIEIPDILGKDIEKITQELAEKGIIVEQVGSEYNSEYEEGQIMTQNPVAGTKTTSKRIEVEVSKGTKMVMVKSVEGSDIKVAKYQLENTLGFIVEQEDVVSDTVASGIVISQDYKDVERPYGSIIKLKVSSGDGKAKVIVPNVVGKSISEAKKQLEDAKLVVEVTYGENEEKLNGTVLEQSYPQNSVLKEGDLIKLTVNRRVISKTITIDGIPAGTQESAIEVKVSVDGGVSNSTRFSYNSETGEISFTISGYEKISYSVSIDGSVIKSGEESL